MADMKINTIIQGDCLEVMKDFPDNSIDLTVTSPPYDNLRNYAGFSFDFEGIGKELFRITKQGGVVVWVVGDQCVDGSETGSSFEQALGFKKIGFNLHDTMIYQKNGIAFPNPKRYHQCFEYMFILSKGAPQTVNLIQDRNNRQSGEVKKQRYERQVNGEVRTRVNESYTVLDIGTRWNIWQYETGYMKSTKDKGAYSHPAIFPEMLAKDHIISWSNPGDVVLDPFMGSGTTAKAAKETVRNYIGIELNPEYIKIANQRLQQEKLPLFT